MEKLVTGVHRFQSTYFAENRALYARLAKHGQTPETLFITCADSRISPTHLTQTQPGELFMIRNAGNMMPTYEQAKQIFSGEAATMQYAVEVLGVRDIIVCGHTDCGAIKALTQSPEKLKQLDLVAAWVEQTGHLRDILASNYCGLDGERLLKVAIEENVLIQMEDIRTYPFIRERLEDRRLSLHGWVYHIAHGQVFAYDPACEQFLPIEQVYRAGTGDLAAMEVQP